MGWAGSVHNDSGLAILFQVEWRDSLRVTLPCSETRPTLLSFHSDLLPSRESRSSRLRKLRHQIGASAGFASSHPFGPFSGASWAPESLLEDTPLRKTLEELFGAFGLTGREKEGR